MTGRAVCFDLDDTLYDYHRYARSGLEAAADRLESRFGRSFHDELRSIYFDDAVTEGTFDELCRRHGLPVGIVDDLVEAFHGADDPLEPYPEVPPVLDLLSESHRLAVVTDGRGGRGKLRRLELDSYFDAVMVAPAVGRSKDDPVVFRRVLTALSVPPGRAVYVGDDPRADFRVPNGIGMGTVRLRRGRYAHLEPPDESLEPDHEIDRLVELLPLVGGEVPPGVRLPER